MKQQNIHFALVFYSMTLVIILVVHYYQIIEGTKSQEAQLTVQSFKHMVENTEKQSYSFMSLNEIVAHHGLDEYSYQIFIENKEHSQIKQSILPRDDGYEFGLPQKPNNNGLVLHSSYRLDNDGLKGWIKLPHDALLSVHLLHKPAVLESKKIGFWVPLLLAIFCWIVSGLYLLERISFWNKTLDYANNLTKPNIQIQKYNTYQPLQFTGVRPAPDFRILANAMSRANYQLHHRQRQVDTLVNRLDRLVHNAPLPMAFIQRNGKLNFINERFKSLFLVSLKGGGHYYLTDFVTGKDKQTQQLLEDLESQRISRSMIVKRVHNEHVYQLHIMPWFSDHGQTQGFTAMLSNINLINTELENNVKELNSKALQLAEFDKIWSVMGHELRTPLSGIIGMLDLLQSENLNKEQIETFDTLKQTSQTMLQMLNDMLDLAKLDAGRLHVTLEKTDILQICRQICELMVGNARRQDIELLFFYDLDTIRYIQTDEARLRQVLLNLVGNAIKFTQSGYVALVVSLEQIEESGAQLLFEIMDTGIGISIEEQKRLFSYFGQANTGISSKFGGTGLGLAISKNFAKLLNAQIGVNSTVGEGSRFYVSLPVSLDYPQTVYQYTSDFSKVALIYISSTKMSGDYITKFCDSYKISVLVEYAIDKESTDSINQWLTKQENFGLNSVLFVDHEVIRNYEKSAKDPFKKLHNSDQLPKVLMSMTPERSLSMNFTERFQGYIQKPLDISYFVSELLRLGNKQQSLSRISKLQHSFNEFIQDIDEEQLSNISDRETDLADKLINAGFESCELSTVPSKQLVLVAEDNPINQKVVVKLLTNMGYATITANNGEEAIEQLDEYMSEVKLILMDCRMPKMDGMDATRKIRESGNSIPIVALTANDTDQDRKACLHSGMDNFLAKPIKREALQALLNKYAI